MKVKHDITFWRVDCVWTCQNTACLARITEDTNY